MDDERRQVLNLLQRHGWNALSFQVLGPHFRYWLQPDAAVAYVDTGHAWVAAGAPIAAPAELPSMAEAFVKAACDANRRAVFFGVEDRFRAALPGMRTVLLGEQPAWDPSKWEDTLAHAPSLREQLRRARAKGVTVTPVDSAAALADPRLAEQVDALAQRWLEDKPMAPLGFLVALQPLAFLGERQAWRADAHDQLVGWMTTTPLYARDGFLVEHLLRDPAAPNGTAELMVHTALTRGAQEGKQYVTLGLVPLWGDVPAPLLFVRRLASVLYNFDGLRRFKAKLRPTRWERVWLALPTRQGTVASVWDVLTAFAGGQPVRFVWDTVKRGPSWALKLLAGLLIPWTAMLALAPTARWFPAEIVKWAWVAFDVGLGVSLFMLARRWHHGLGRLLAMLVTADAALTLTEAILFNLRHSQGLLTLAVVALSVAAPATAAVLLWSWHRSQREAA